MNVTQVPKSANFFRPGSNREGLTKTKLLKGFSFLTLFKSFFFKKQLIKRPTKSKKLKGCKKKYEMTISRNPKRKDTTESQKQFWILRFYPSFFFVTTRTKRWTKNGKKRKKLSKRPKKKVFSFLRKKEDPLEWGLKLL